MGEVRRSTLLLLAALTVCVLIGFTYHRPSVVGGALVFHGIDAVGLPTETLRIGARLHRPNALGFLRGVPGVTVNFYLDARVVGGAITDAEGRAVTDFVPPRGPGFYRIEARAEGTRAQDLSAEILAAAMEPDDRLVVVDIDRAVADPPSFLASLFRRYGEFRPALGARETLDRLFADYHLVYLSDRAHRYTRHTKNWLRAHSFPSGPVFFKGWELYGGTLDDYKKEILRRLVRGWTHPIVAIGDSTRDARVFEESGVQALIIGSRRDTGLLPPRAIPAKNWREVLHVFDRHRF